MRSSTPVTFLSLLLPTLAASVATSECLKSKATELAVESVCGDIYTTLQCLQNASASEDALEATIEECLTKAGCTRKMAVSEASYLATLCEGEPSELKRRQREGKSTILFLFLVVFGNYEPSLASEGRIAFYQKGRSCINGWPAWLTSPRTTSFILPRSALEMTYRTS